MPPVKTPTNFLQKNTTVSAALQCVVAACLEQLQVQVAGIIKNGDSECIHQARVTLRRLRSANNAFHGVCELESWRYIRDEARWLASQLGAVRDLQLLQINILPAMTSANSAWIDTQPLHAELQKKLAIALERLMKALRSQRYARFLRKVQSWLASELASNTDALQKLAEHSLERRWQRTVKLAKQWRELDAAGRHTLRKQFKKLRYSIEFFAPLFSQKRVKNYLQKLKKIQQLLGDLNDSVSAQHLLIPLLKQSRCRSAVYAGLGWLSHDEQQQLKRIESRIEQWCDYKKF